MLLISNLVFSSPPRRCVYAADDAEDADSVLGLELALVVHRREDADVVLDLTCFLKLQEAQTENAMMIPTPRRS